MNEIPPNEIPSADRAKEIGGGEDAPKGNAEAPKPRKRGRRWLKVVGGLVVLLVALVALAPTIASTGWMRGIILERVNAKLNGTVEADDWSLGWFSKMKATGVRVKDAEGNVIVNIASAETDLTLWRAIRGDFDLGQTTAQGEVTYASYRDGTNSFSRLKKPGTGGGDRAAPAAEPPKPIHVPNVKGDVKFTGKVTLVQMGSEGPAGVVSPAAAKPVVLDDIEFTAHIDDINEGVKNAFHAVCKVDGKALGSISASGAPDLVNGNHVDLHHLTAMKGDEVVEIDSLSAGALAPFLPMLAQRGITVDDGAMAGRIALVFNGDTIHFDDRLSCKGLSATASGQALDGYAADFMSAGDVQSREGQFIITLAAFNYSDGGTALTAGISGSGPLVVRYSTGGGMEASGAIAANGKLAPWMNVVAAFTGKPVMPYTGEFSTTQTFAVEGGSTHATGGIRMDNLAVAAAGKPPFLEKRLELGNDISLDAAAKMLVMNKVSLASDALRAEAKGRIANFSTNMAFLPLSPEAPEGQRGVVVTLAYDAAKLKALLEPMFPAMEKITLEQAPADRTQVIAGNYPLGQPWREAVKSLEVRGDVGLSLLGLLADEKGGAPGISITQVRPAYTLKRGIVVMTDLPAAPATRPAGAISGGPGVVDAQAAQSRVSDQAQFNSGVMNLAGAKLNLTKEMPHLALPKGKLLVNAQINQIFANKVLAMAMPLFNSTSEATGPMTVTVQSCDDLPLDWLMPDGPDAAPRPLSEGKKAVFHVSAAKLNLLSGPIKDLQTVLSITRSGTSVKALPITITDGILEIDRGHITINVPVKVGSAVLSLTGDINVKKMEIVQMDMAIPREFFAALGVGKSVERILPPVVHAPFEGKLTAPKFDLAKAVKSSLLGPGGLVPDKLEDLLKNLLGSGEDGGKQDNSGGGLNGLIDRVPDLLNGGKKDDKPKGDEKKPASRPARQRGN